MPFLPHRMSLPDGELPLATETPDHFLRSLPRLDSILQPDTTQAVSLRIHEDLFEIIKRLKQKAVVERANLTAEIFKQIYDSFCITPTCILPPQSLSSAVFRFLDSTHICLRRLSAPAMDPYLDIIPDDRGEEIRKRVRERDGSDSEGRLIKRARADTSALLPPGDDGQDVEEPEPPKPEEDLDKYDRERLQKGLRYINGAAKRKITPRTQEFLKLHKDAYKAALDGEAPEKASCAVVQAMDQVYYSAAFFFKPCSLEDYEHHMYYVKLRRLEFLANYGDYLGQELREIRADLKAAAIGARPEVREAALELGPPKTWLTIANELADANMGDLRKHVYTACGVLGIDPNHMLWLIEEWGEKHSNFHNQIRQYVSDCHWGRLAEQVCCDLKELLNVAPNLDTVANYEKVLLRIQNEYFDTTSRDDPQLWLPNEKARKLTEDKLAREKKRAQK